MAPVEIKFKILIEKNGKAVFAQGQYLILKAINERHSLDTAALKLCPVGWQAKAQDV